MGAEFVHFEIAADDVEKLVRFYADALGWTFRGPLGEAFGEYEGYRLFMTGDDKSVGGGVLKKGQPLDYGVNYFQVDDLGSAAARVKAAGGKVVFDEHEVPMVGTFVICQDPEGNRFGLWKQVEK